MTTKINGRTPEEIKRKLGCLLIQENGGCEDNYTCHSCNYHNKVYMDDGDCFKATLAYIQQLEAGIDRIYKQIDALRGLPEKIQQLERERDAAVVSAQPKWISVEERLPEDGVKVLAAIHYYDGYKIKTARYSNAPDKKPVWFIGDMCAVGSTPTHWMPLPEPPKEV